MSWPQTGYCTNGTNSFKGKGLNTNRRQIGHYTNGKLFHRKVIEHDATGDVPNPAFVEARAVNEGLKLRFRPKQFCQRQTQEEECSADSIMDWTELTQPTKKLWNRRCNLQLCIGSPHQRRGWITIFDTTRVLFFSDFARRVFKTQLKQRMVWGRQCMHWPRPNKGSSVLCVEFKALISGVMNGRAATFANAHRSFKVGLLYNSIWLTGFRHDKAGVLPE